MKSIFEIANTYRVFLASQLLPQCESYNEAGGYESGYHPANEESNTSGTSAGSDTNVDVADSMCLTTPWPFTRKNCSKMYLQKIPNPNNFLVGAAGLGYALSAAIVALGIFN